MRLERLHFLDRSDPHHLWLLHTLFLDDIQEDCDEFCKHWNSHPLSGKGENMTPLVCSHLVHVSFHDFVQGSPLYSTYQRTIFSQDLRLLGQTKYGVYDKTDTIDPALLHRYYGAGGSNTDNDDTMGPAFDEDGQSQRDIAEIIADAQSRNIRHEAAEVAKNSSPFEDERDLIAFTLALQSVLGSKAFPDGFRLNEEYESFETYKTGRSVKPLVIPLPYNVWFPRIVVWCKALDILKRLPLCKAML